MNSRGLTPNAADESIGLGLRLGGPLREGDKEALICAGVGNIVPAADLHSVRQTA